MQGMRIDICPGPQILLVNEVIGGEIDLVTKYLMILLWCLQLLQKFFYSRILSVNVQCLGISQ